MEGQAVDRGSGERRRGAAQPLLELSWEPARDSNIPDVPEPRLDPLSL